MTTGDIIFSALSGDATVRQLVGTRIYPNLLPQGTKATDTYAAIVYQVISDVPQNTFADAPSRRQARVQIDCYTKQYQIGQTIADAVDLVMNALSRSDLSAWRESSRDFYDDMAQMHRVSMDISVWR